MSILRAVLFLAVASSAVAAQGRGRGNDKGPPPKQAQAARAKYTDQDRDSDSRVIITWFRDHPGERSKPGRGNGGLPPGYEKKLIRSAPIPVAYRAYIVPAPALLVRTLPPVRPGWAFVMIDNRVLLIDRPSWQIIDIVAVL